MTIQETFLPFRVFGNVRLCDYEQIFKLKCCLCIFQIDDLIQDKKKDPRAMFKTWLQPWFGVENGRKYVNRWYDDVVHYDFWWIVGGQKWSRSDGLHAFTSRGKTQPPTNHGAGPPHSQSSHIQGRRHKYSESLCVGTSVWTLPASVLRVTVREPGFRQVFCSPCGSATVQTASLQLFPPSETSTHPTSRFELMQRCTKNKRILNETITYKKQRQSRIKNKNAELLYAPEL